MKTVTLPDGSTMPRLGQGTWLLGDSEETRAQEIEALREGVRLGMTLIDTAEMYGDGRSERLVGEAISDCRDEVYVVSKVTPGGNRAQIIASCENSLRNLGTDRLDLYLLHWSGGTEFEETVDAFSRLVADGKIRRFGVSNLDIDELQDFCSVPGGEATQANQLLFNLGQRGIEADLLPWIQRKRMAMMAYSPFDRVDLVRHRGLADFAQARGITTGQAALAWLLGHDQVVPIPKASLVDRVRENAAALDVSLTAEDRDELDRLFPPPNGPQPLAIY